jgi:hypothetical protein
MAENVGQKPGKKMKAFHWSKLRSQPGTPSLLPPSLPHFNSPPLLPSSLFLLVPPRSSLFLLVPPHSSSFLLIPPRSSSSLLVPPRSASFLLVPPHSSSFLLVPPRSSSSDKVLAIESSVFNNLHPNNVKIDLQELEELFSAVEIQKKEGEDASKPSTCFFFWFSGFTVSGLCFPFSVFRFPFSDFRCPFSVFRFLFSVFRFLFSVFRFPFSVFPFSVFRVPGSVISLF